MQALIRHRWLVPVDSGGSATWVRVLEHLGHSVHVDRVSGVAAIDSVLFRRRVILHVEGGDVRARAALEQQVVALLRAAGAAVAPAVGSRDEPPAPSDVAVTVTMDAVAHAATVEGARHRPLASWRLARELARALQAPGRYPVRQRHMPAGTWELLPAHPAGVAGPVVRVSVPAGWPVAELATALFTGLVTYFGGPRQPLSLTAPVAVPELAGARRRSPSLPALAGHGDRRNYAAALPAGGSPPGSGGAAAGSVLAGHDAAAGPLPGGDPVTGTPPAAGAAVAGAASTAPPQSAHPSSQRGDLGPSFGDAVPHAAGDFAQAGALQAGQPEPIPLGSGEPDPATAAGPVPEPDAGLPAGKAPDGQAGPARAPETAPGSEATAGQYAGQYAGHDPESASAAPAAGSGNTPAAGPETEPPAERADMAEPAPQPAGTASVGRDEPASAPAGMEPAAPSAPPAERQPVDEEVDGERAEEPVSDEEPVGDEPVGDAEPADAEEPVDFEALEGTGHEEPQLPPERTGRWRRRRPVLTPGLPAGIPREVLPPGARTAYSFALFRPAGRAQRGAAFPATPSEPATAAGVTGQHPAGRPQRQPMRAVPSFSTGRAPGSLRPFR